LEKGAMTLTDDDRAAELYERMGPVVEVSGGSAANTLAGVASLGGTGAYIGKVRNDTLGEVFRHDIRAAGVDYRSRPAGAGPQTARCLIFVTPDAQRTMQTFLGISTEFGPDDVDPELVGGAQITYLEGYLFDKEPAKEAFVKAAELAHHAGRKVALSLSDAFCVDRHRAAFRHLVAGHIDILFANEAEITALYEVDDFDEACRLVGKDCGFAAVTKGADGSAIIENGAITAIAAEPAARVVDTTGAGDLYASGVLYGLARGMNAADCGRIGAIAAAEIISHYGARPEACLADLVARAGVGGS
jgi:sugar/nucleoside kinase (ribokinase family)